MSTPPAVAPPLLSSSSLLFTEDSLGILLIFFHCISPFLLPSFVLAPSSSCSILAPFIVCIYSSIVLPSPHLGSLHAGDVRACGCLQEREGVPDDALFTEAEVQYTWSTYDEMMGPLSDMSEISIQFGYVTLFVVAFPLAPVSA